MFRPSSRQTSPVCRIMIALAILGTCLAPLCDADRVAQSIDAPMDGSDLPDYLADLGTDAGQPSDEETSETAPADDADLPGNDDNESLGHAGGPIFLVEVRANPRPHFPLVGLHRDLDLAPRRARASSTSAPPRATDLPTRLCRWTC